MKIVASSFQNDKSLILLASLLSRISHKFEEVEGTLVTSSESLEIIKIIPFIDKYEILEDHNEEALSSLESQADFVIRMTSDIARKLDLYIRGYNEEILETLNPPSACKSQIREVLEEMRDQGAFPIVNFQETNLGYSSSKELLKKSPDILICPFNEDENIQNMNVVEFCEFFIKMNEKKKILIIGLPRHEVFLNNLRKKLSKYSEIELSVVSYECALSLINKSRHFVTGVNTLRFLVKNRETTVYDVHDSLESIYSSGIYKDLSYQFLLNKESLLKIVYNSEEIIFKNNAHFLSYFITAEIDNDFEKMLLLTEGFRNKIKVYRTSVHPDYGWRCIPFFWNRESALEFIIYHSIKYAGITEQGDLLNNVYDYLMEDSDYSFEQMFYEADGMLKLVQTQMISLRKQLGGSKKERESGSSENILDSFFEVLSIFDPALSLKSEHLGGGLDSRDIRISALNYLSDLYAFLSSFKDISSHRILENFDSVGDLRI